MIRIRMFGLVLVTAVVLAGCSSKSNTPPPTVLKTVNPDGTESCAIQDPNGDHKNDMKLNHCYPAGTPSGWVTQTVTATP